MRLIENVPANGYDSETFLRELDALVTYLDKTGKANVILTTGFWKHPGDSDLRAYAKEKGMECIELGDLGECDGMKAIGLFSHDGVANHPGDKGMKAIADRIMNAILRQNG